MYIIFEGLEGTGKTELIAELNKKQMPHTFIKGGPAGVITYKQLNKKISKTVYKEAENDARTMVMNHSYLTIFLERNSKDKQFNDAQTLYKKNIDNLYWQNDVCTLNTSENTTEKCVEIIMERIKKAEKRQLKMRIVDVKNKTFDVYNMCCRFATEDFIKTVQLVGEKEINNFCVNLAEDEIAVIQFAPLGFTVIAPEIKLLFSCVHNLDEHKYECELTGQYDFYSNRCCDIKYSFSDDETVTVDDSGLLKNNLGGMLDSLEWLFVTMPCKDIIVANVSHLTDKNCCGIDNSSDNNKSYTFKLD